MPSTMRRSRCRFRMLTRQQLLQLSVPVAMVLLCCYGVSVYRDSISLDPYFLNPTSAPNVLYNDVHKKKLISLSQQYSELKPNPRLATSYRDLSYLEVVTKLASPEKQIILSLIDGGFLQMALNFHVTCLKRFHIENYLFLATDQASCDRLLAVGIHCYVYQKDLSAKEASVYHSPAFLRKMNIRTTMILEALHAGVEVIHSDVDIFCYKHMLENLDCRDCDVSTLWDGKSHNAGFVYIKPTQRGKQLYKEMKEMVKQNTSLDDQNQLNYVLGKMQTRYWDLKFRDLGKGYQCGVDYYETPARFFAPDAAPCPECVVVHNNWIISMEAKVYRAKEMHHWMYDGNQYYSSTSRKYLIYDNPLVGRRMGKAEKEALVNGLAIGQILNRTLILPKFHCGRTTCPLNALINIQKFDKQFGGVYREHTFLSHPLVPSSVRSSVYGPVLLKTKYLVEHAGPDLDLVPRQQDVMLDALDAGMTDIEVKGHFGKVTDPVLRFFSFYQVFVHFTDTTQQQQFMQKVALGIVDDDYKQSGTSRSD